MISIITHSGSFHSDELFAIALIKKFISSNVDIIRTRDESVLKKGTSDSNVWVVDVGRGYDEKLKNFDHHQRDFTKMWPKTNIPYSSCGLVWLYLRRRGYLGKKYSNWVIKSVEERLIKKIDMHDNRVKIWPQATIFRLCNRENNSIDDFKRALMIAEVHLEDTLHYFANIENERNEVDKMELLMDGEVALLNKRSHSFIGKVSKDTDAKIIIMPKGDGGSWSVRCINSNDDEYLAPSGWRGLSGDELVEKSGVKGLIFVHKSGFLAVTKNKKSAIRVANRMVN